MYEQLKTMMPHADYFYGPVTREQAFDVPHHSYAVPMGNQWYIGVNKELAEYQNIAIAKPETPAETTEAPVTTETQP